MCSLLWTRRSSRAAFVTLPSASFSFSEECLNVLRSTPCTVATAFSRASLRLLVRVIQASKQAASRSPVPVKLAPMSGISILTALRWPPFLLLPYNRISLELSDGRYEVSTTMGMPRSCSTSIASSTELSVVMVLLDSSLRRQKPQNALGSWYMSPK
uniref:Uncharacterized protein n=1 Tax=Ixodes ricinus TaxID=34613 RepID=A0A6B0UWN5_IXORI